MAKKSSQTSSQPRNPSDALVAKVWGFCNTLRDDGSADGRGFVSIRESGEVEF